MNSLFKILNKRWFTCMQKISLCCPHQQAAAPVRALEPTAQPEQFPKRLTPAAQLYPGRKS